MKEYNDYSLKEMNTFRVEAKAKKLIDYASVDELIALYPLPETFLHVGGGSNLLFVGDYDGVVLHSSIKGRTIVDENADRVTVEVGAGENWDDFVRWSVEKEYWGVENLSLIPGEVGAAAVQNIGAYGVEICDVLAYVDVCTEGGKVERWPAKDMRYSYRYSRLKEKEEKKNIVVRVGINLQKNYAPVLTYRALQQELERRGVDLGKLSPKYVRDRVIEVRRSKLPDVEEVGSAGSFFMNPILSAEQFDGFVARHPHVPYYKLSTDAYKIPAGWLVDQAGWKGVREGDVGVYPKQALVIVNWGNATGEEVASFSKKIQNDVAEKFGVDLHSEVLFVE